MIQVRRLHAHLRAQSPAHSEKIGSCKNVIALKGNLKDIGASYRI